MKTIELRTAVAAPPSRTFDLALSMDLHSESMVGHQETIVAGVKSGLIGPGQTVTFRARHFLLTFELQAQVTLFQPPNRFQDVMVRGPFKEFAHDHWFYAEAPGTLMVDSLQFEAPFGFAGRPFELLLAAHLTNVLRARAKSVKQIAESDAWQRYLPAAPLAAHQERGKAL